MKHGIKLKTLSRDSGHRKALLRNLVTSVLQHEQIKTTVPKARAAARLVEKVISYGKHGDMNSWKSAQGSVLDSSVLRRVFGEYATRYASRPGGYTRIHNFGRRPGDNAPMAILELVDNPRDIKSEMTARAVGWEILEAKLREREPGEILKNGINLSEIQAAVQAASEPEGDDTASVFKEKTRRNLQQVSRYQPQVLEHIGAKAHEYMNELIAQPIQMNSILDSLYASPSEKAKIGRRKNEENLRASQYDPTKAQHASPYTTADSLSTMSRRKAERTARDLEGATEVLTGRKPGAVFPGERRGAIGRAKGSLGAFKDIMLRKPYTFANVTKSQ